MPLSRFLHDKARSTGRLRASLRAGRAALGALLGVVAALTAVEVAAAPVCGRSYSPMQGDTLSVVALLAFGDSERWREIYDHGENADILNPSPDAPLGAAAIRIPPCNASANLNRLAKAFPVLGAPAVETQEDDAAPPPPAYEPPSRSERPRRRPAAPPAAASFTAEAATVPATQRVAEPSIAAGRSIRVLTGEAFAPFVDAAAPEGGLATHLVRAAFETAGLAGVVDITPDADWSGHMAQVTAAGPAALAFPRSRALCADAAEGACAYVFSDPIYVAANEIYGRAGAPAPRTLGELASRRLCEVAGKGGGLVEDDRVARAVGARVAGPSIGACFEMLRDGRVDLVSANRFTARMAKEVMQLDGVIAAYPGLATAETMRLVAHRDHPDAAALIGAVNQGLSALKRSGLYGQIIDWHLQQFRRRF